MPIYEYRCKDCSAVSEYLVGVGSATDALACKQCGSSHLEKMISAAHPLKASGRPSGRTCCGREERCSTPPCHTGEGCRHD